jgi:cytoskeleton protein RodZ
MRPPVSSVAGDAPEAVRCGASLREARERLGWSLPQVASGLRISLSRLESLEDGRIDQLPGNAYAIGYVRAYATLIGLDAEEMVRRFKREAADVALKTELTFPVPMPERGMPAGALMLVGVLLCVVAYTGWYRLSGEGRLPAETVPPIPERLAPLAQQALPPPAVIVMTKPPEPAPVAAVPMVVAAEPAPAAPPISPSSAAAALVHEPVDDAGAASASAVDHGRVVLRAIADAWVQVKDRSGALLLNRILKSGEIWPVPRQDLVMTTGNAGGTEVLVDGVAVAPLGGTGAVRRDVALDPAALNGSKTVAAAQQAAVPPVVPTRGHQ